MSGKKLKRLLAEGAFILSVVLLANVFLPFGRKAHADGKTAISDADITNITTQQSGLGFSGELDYHIPKTITKENGIVTFDFSKVNAYYQDGSGQWKTNGKPALDFSRFNLEGPIIIDDSYYYHEFETEIKDFMNTKDATALKNAGYPYWYTFDKSGVVDLDYRAMFDEHNGQRDYDILVGANSSSYTSESYVVFSCELNEEAFNEAGGDYILSFITSSIESQLNPRVHIDPPTTLDRDIDVTKTCTNFDFDKGTVEFTVRVENKGEKPIASPIELKDELDEGLSFVSVTSYDSRYIDPVSSKNTSSVYYFTLDGLPAHDYTTIKYSCRLNSKFYQKNQNLESNTAGNTVTAKAVPEGGTTPIPVELNDQGDLSIHVAPPDLNYEKMSKTGSYSRGRYSWSIQINNGTNTLHSDLRDVVLFDTITYNTDNNPVLIDGQVTITNANDPSLSHVVSGVSIESFKDPGIKLQASWFDNTDSDGIYIGGPRDTYQITYATSTGDNLDQLTVDQKVTNVASMRDGTRWIGSVGRDVDGPSGFSLKAEKEIDKDNVTYSESGSKTRVNMPWIIKAYVPLNFDDELVFSDYLASSSGMTFDFDRMSSTVADIYYIDNGQEVSVPSTLSMNTLSDGSTVLEADVDKDTAVALSGETLYWRVCTTATVETSRLSENEVIFHNGGMVNDKDLDAAFATRGPSYYMNKHSVKFNESNSDATWTLVYNHDNNGHVLESHNWTSIHIVDDLHGMIFTGYHDDAGQVKTIINNQDGSPYLAYAKDLGDGTFEIIVDDAHPLKDASGKTYYLKDLIKNGERIVFEYHTTIPKSIYPIVNKGKIENTATSENVDDNGVTFTQTPSAASVTVEYPIVQKTDVGSMHDYNQVDYVITVNPYALNLSRDGSGSYYVVDTLGSNIDYVVDSLKVYEKKTEASNKAYVTGDKLYTLDTVIDKYVASGTYEFSIVGKDLIIRVPEGVELFISYTVRLTFATSGTVTNTVSMPLTYPGNSEDEAGRTATSKRFEISSSSAGSRPTYALFYIDKVGENDPSHFLGNIRFIVEEYDLSGDATGNVFSGTTTSDRTLSADSLTAPAGQTIKTPRDNYIYVVYEDPNQTAPSGYTISTQKVAFYVPSNANYVADPASSQKLGVQVQSVVNGKHFLFVNEVNKLTIGKTFNGDGGKISDVSFTIRGTGSTVYSEKTIERAGNQFIVSNLPIGTYEIRETATSSGYDKLSGTISVVVNSDKSIRVSEGNGVTILQNSNSTADVSIEVMNTKSKGYITINKTISGPVTEEDIAGLTFEITYKDLNNDDVTIKRTLKDDFNVTKSGDTYTCTLKNVIEVPDASKPVTVVETLYDLSAKGFDSSVVSSRVGTASFTKNEAGQTVAKVSTDSKNATNFDYQDDYTKPAPPSEPSTPSEPSAPSEPSTPSEPSSPSEPSTPSEPSEPSTPSAPSEPSEPSEPSSSSALAKPAAPAEPSEPSETSTVSEPSESSESTKEPSVSSTSKPAESASTEPSEENQILGAAKEPEADVMVVEAKAPAESSGVTKADKTSRIVKTGEAVDNTAKAGWLLLTAAFALTIVCRKRKKAN